MILQICSDRTAAGKQKIAEGRPLADGPAPIRVTTGKP